MRARQELADRLRDIRLDAGLTGRALPAAAGWREAKSSRVESAKQAPSDPRDASRYGTVLPAVDLSARRCTCPCLSVIVLFPEHKTRYRLCIVHADDDPIMLVHANALLTGTDGIVIADLREPEPSWPIRKTLRWRRYATRFRGR